MHGSDNLISCLRRKQDELRSTLDELGVEAMDDKMKLAAEVPVTRPYRLAHLVQNRAEQIGGAQVDTFEASGAL